MKTRLIVWELDAETGAKSVADIMELDGDTASVMAFKPHLKRLAAHIPFDDMLVGKAPWSFVIERIADDGTTTRDPTVEELDEDKLIRVLDRDTPRWWIEWADKRDLIALADDPTKHRDERNHALKRVVVRSIVGPSVNAAISAGLVTVPERKQP